METIQVTLPTTTRAFIDAEVASGAYRTPDDFICALIEKAQQRKLAHARVETLLLQGLTSGDPIEVSPEFWAERCRRLEDAIRASGEP
jgi:antitoxin ParD1/3/4